jgi:molecular chaperone DnaK (HSP70)
LKVFSSYQTRNITIASLIENAPSEEGAIEVATLSKSIGIEHGNGKMSKIFTRGSVIPSKRSFTCAFFDQHQNSLFLKIVEGESENISECTALGSLGMTLVEIGTEVEVTFQLDVAQLKVTLRNKKTQQSEVLQIPISISSSK